MKRTAYIIGLLVFILGSPVFAEDEPAGTNKKINLSAEVIDKKGDNVQLKEKIKPKQQEKLTKDDKSSGPKAVKEKSAVKNNGDEKKIKAVKREKKALKREAREQKKEMREEKKMNQEMKKGGSGKNSGRQ